MKVRQIHITRFIKAGLLIVTIAFTAFSVNEIHLFQGASDKVFELKSGEISMKVSSDGGRIISFTLGNHEILTQEKEHENFGSTLWIAPQSDWGWPPYKVLDNERYDVEEDGDELKMKSKEDEESGLQIEKTWEIVNGNTVQITYQIKNISDFPKYVGAWEVTRVPCGGVVFFAQGDTTKLPPSKLEIDLKENGINWLSIDKIPKQENQKLFSSASGGWLSYARNDVLFIKQFPDIEISKYSPQQGEVEIYVNKDKSYIELENQGEYTLLQADQSLSYRVKWSLVKLPEYIRVSLGEEELTNYVRQIVSTPKSKERKKSSYEN